MQTIHQKTSLHSLLIQWFLEEGHAIKLLRSFSGFSTIVLQTRTLSTPWSTCIPDGHIPIFLPRASGNRCYTVWDKLLLLHAKKIILLKHQSMHLSTTKPNEWEHDDHRGASERVCLWNVVFAVFSNDSSL